MLYKRIIPCLDIIGNNVVKGKKFKKIIKLGKVQKLAKKYYKDGADEIVVLNISKEKINNFSKVIKKISKEIKIPLTVGGNINSLKDAKIIFKSGADRISLNSSLFKKNLIEKISNRFGSQSTVASIDVKKIKKKWFVYINGGKTKTNCEVLYWVKKCVKKGVGEILLTSINNDGINNGYDIKLIKYIDKNINVPVISSGGAGTIKNIFEVFKKTKINSVLLASILHKKKENIKNIKKKLSKNFLIRI
ncbi:Imidazole glycerol phosphate synthase cyclase subunit [Candidatus Vidania fulgoroideae]|uniref:Imidazole glycerol phosphate synthase cyclase subunit n=1 Tax=Candidatus Vidania fulgoroideorum TaxID=881286 RepID=A0A346E0I2_9PROT|nr:Imidazole glycerol phosphate synthase cyclase subunit [Candidatus Vidania fulgoroideae]WDI79437.1 HisA/HisF-related TIM barrel protein [Candidatus Vidania fulgoroideae]WDR79184.1 HisA/HisF-related TIM barrel protein [Candidatus Vidania fulgoroideae]